jgi:hypothetical protein
MSDQRDPDRRGEFSKELDDVSRQITLRVLAICTLVSIAVAAGVGLTVGLVVVDKTSEQAHNGQLYNCQQQTIGRIQGRSRAFVQKQFLRSHAAIRQISATADAAVAATLSAQVKQAGPLTKKQRKAADAYIMAFEQLAEVSEAAADYWLNDLDPLIQDLPLLRCDKVFENDTPPAVIVPEEEELPQPPPILRPRG